MSNYDDALERFQRVGLEYADGLANHGPMGAEALESLGHHAKIQAFVDIYAPRLPPLERGEVLDQADRSAALGQIEAAPRWVATFEACEAWTEEVGWREFARTELPALLPGLFAGAGHGLLRVAHALRALEREESALRARELAHGLAYWASRYQELPGSVGDQADKKGLCVADALESWPLLGEPESRKGYFFRIVERLDDFAPYAEALADVALPGPDDVDVFLDALCAGAAHLYVGHPQARIAYVHALTLPSAMRFLVPYLAPEDAVRACGYVLQAVGALHSLFGEAEPRREEDEEVERVSQDWDEIRYHAACSIQEHSIKMTEACWREDKRRPNPIFRRAGADAALKIGGRGDASVC